MSLFGLINIFLKYDFHLSCCINQISNKNDHSSHKLMKAHPWSESQDILLNIIVISNKGSTTACFLHWLCNFHRIMYKKLLLLIRIACLYWYCSICASLANSTMFNKGIKYIRILYICRLKIFKWNPHFAGCHYVVNVWWMKASVCYCWFLNNQTIVFWKFISFLCKMDFIIRKPFSNRD